MTSGAIGASVIFGAWLGFLAGAAAQLPPEIMVDLYQLRADRLMEDKDPVAALEMINKIIDLHKEHDQTLPDGFHFRYAEIALSAGSFQDAMDAAGKYLLAVGRTDPQFRKALEIMDEAEQLQIWVETRQTCTGQSKGAECWMAISGRPECYLWNPDLKPGETGTWTGECSRGQAQGKGTLKLVWKGSYKIASTTSGSLQGGKQHGHWVEYLDDGSFQDGNYVEARRHGSWHFLSATGNSRNGSYVDGKKHGRWVEHDLDGTSLQGPYVEGKRHGRWEVQHSDGTRHEGPYIKGKRHGIWTVRENDGSIFVETYRNGKLVTTE